MSLDTWKAEFYPIPADKVPIEDAVQHSLRKWRGLTKENLEKHGVVKKKAYITDGDDYESEFLISACSCSLCKHYLSDLTDCHGCPLSEVLGGRCDEGSDKYYQDDSPYRQFTRDDNPLPMIEALEKVAKLEPAIK